jgi:uncharacterized protein (DUF433 family)
MIAFIRGTRTPVFTIATPSSAKTPSNAVVYLLSVCREHGEELDVGRAT